MEICIGLPSDILVYYLFERQETDLYLRRYSHSPSLRGSME